MAESAELLQLGSIELPLQLTQVTSLLALEATIEAKIAASFARGLHVGLSSPVSPEPLQAEAGDMEERVVSLATLVSEGAGSEQEWALAVEQNDFALYRALVLILAHIPLPPASFDALLRTTYILGTLAPARLYSIVCQHPASLNKLLESIFPELEASELTTRFRLLDLLLVETYGRKPTDLPTLTIDLEETQKQIMTCLANDSASVFSLATSSMLLLNTLDSKRSLHRCVIATQAELLNSLASSGPGSPATSLSTEALSRFSQELITLINAGRLPAMWEEEPETSSTHSGVNGTDGVVDLYQSTRAVVRAMPDRDPDCAALTSGTLAFLSELFHNETALDLLYTNDIQVLVEVIIRKVEDSGEASERLQLLLDHLLALAAIVSWPEFKERPFKVNEMRELLAVVANNFSQAELSEEQKAGLSETEVDDAEVRLAIHQLATATRQKL